ncbi:MAG: outer membrane beta-barrel protein [Amaricoccus sp.]
MTGTKGLAVAASVVALLAGAGIANAQTASNFYLKGFGGFTFPSNDNTTVRLDGTNVRKDYELNYDTGYTLGVAGGYLVSPSLAVELEYAYRNADLKSDIGGHTSANSLMANAIYRFNPMGVNGEWQPYAGMGIGAGNVDVASDEQGDFQKHGLFAYQLIGGVAYNVTPQLALDGELRWFQTQTDQVTHDGVTADSIGLSTFDVLLGATYHF